LETRLGNPGRIEPFDDPALTLVDRGAPSGEEVSRMLMHAEMEGVRREGIWLRGTSGRWKTKRIVRAASIAMVSRRHRAGRMPLTKVRVLKVLAGMTDRRK
jgi:hypothetical protein